MEPRTKGPCLAHETGEVAALMRKLLNGHILYRPKGTDTHDEIDPSVNQASSEVGNQAVVGRPDA
jgi:hypothetical protein